MYEYHGIKVFAILSIFHRIIYSHNADYARVDGLFYTFHFLPSHRALAFFNTTRKEAKA